MKSESVRNKRWWDKHRKPCPFCNKPMRHTSKTCGQCRHGGWSRGDITLEEAVYRAGHRSSAFALVRTRARAVAQQLGWRACLQCGYDKHVEVIHKRAISTFSLSTKISEINDPNNLGTLCRNHHWEYDHDILPSLCELLDEETRRAKMKFGGGGGG